MMYIHEPSLEKLLNDIRTFIQPQKQERDK